MSIFRWLISKYFLQIKAEYLLVINVLIAFVEFIMMYLAAKKENVLFIDGGIGFLNNYGVMSVILGDALLIYMAKKHVDLLSSINKHSKCIDVKTYLSEKNKYYSILRLETFNGLWLVLFMFIGVGYSVSNISHHVFGTEGQHWNTIVYDSMHHHVLSFLANKICMIYSWILILPFSFYIIIESIFHLNRLLNAILKENIFKYELIHPDKNGGFSYVSRINFYCNMAISILYIQVTMHLITFAIPNSTYYLAYVTITILFLFGNTIFFGSFYKKVEELRLKSLNRYKEDINKNDRFSFEVYKFYHESFIQKTNLGNSDTLIKLTKLVSILIPVIIKLSGKLTQ